ncbi:glutamyl-tRNA reductase [Salinicoccus cyprini]|uniref:Glutamyl-tRNA reductase n=1 Tax=Salinicoccus cyprini TaxID=2493691 RepID=A0A558AZH5_9STAP|nr:glutamyl-tRNA reductase [Salinicoccus cyprini]TVT29637.1 glutamyl-tRNA reductase [Salinicoccus cyprini]
MHVIALSLNYRKASVEEREKVAFQDEEIIPALHRLREQKSVLEAVLLSTCNRTEVYVVSDQVHTGKYYSQMFLADWFSLDLASVKRITDIKVGDEAVEHLYRVASGLESMVLGETQILGQIRDAFFTAQTEHTTGTIFNKLFKEAITVAKRGHNETDISKNAISISYAAVELAKKIFSRVDNRKVLVIGAGEMAEQSLLNLTSNGIRNVTVLNRSEENAARLAGQFNGKSASMDQLEAEIADTDIVISSTASRNYLITEEVMDVAMAKRNGKPLIMMDIALPRDIDPSIGRMDSVYMYNVDDLQGLVDANLSTRQEEAAKIEGMIAESMDKFTEWVNMLGVVPVIQALRSKALSIHEETFQSVERKMPEMTERERTIVSKHMKSIINQMLKDPIIYTKEISGDRKAGEKLDEIMQLFGIEEEVDAVKQQEKAKQQEKLSARKQELAIE